MKSIFDNTLVVIKSVRELILDLHMLTTTVAYSLNKAHPLLGHGTLKTCHYRYFMQT